VPDLPQVPRHIWTPGAPGPHDELVRNQHAQNARLGEDVAVQIELSDGSLYDLISIAPRPGYGFITLEPHPADEEPKEVVVPVGSIAQIRIGRAEPRVRPGFAVPATPEEPSATA
jgi:hypothetical protein